MKQLKKIGVHLIIYFMTSSLLIWASYKVLFFNESISDIKLLYWFLPTITVIIIYLIVLLLYKKHKGFFINHSIVFLCGLSCSNLFSILFVLCDPRRNPTFIVKTILFLLNLILLFFIIKNLKELTLNLNKWIIFFITCLIMYGNYFYTYSINMLYDYLFFALTGIVV